MDLVASENIAAMMHVNKGQSKILKSVVYH
jgi:hypothetical protein